jgi:hypothetical protein
MKRNTSRAGERGLPELAPGIDPSELAELERVWDSLELPPPAPPPPGFARQVTARAAASGANRLEGGVFPHLRWASAAALALGIALGGLLSNGLAGPDEDATLVLASELEDGEADASLAESYLDAVADPAALASATGTAEDPP